MEDGRECPGIHQKRKEGEDEKVKTPRDCSNHLKQFTRELVKY